MDDPILALRHAAREFFGEMGGNRVIEHGRAVLQGPDLLLDRAGHLRVGVAYRNADIHAEKIEVFPALFVPEILPLAAGKDQRRLVGDEGTLRGGVVAMRAGNNCLRRPVSIGKAHAALFDRVEVREIRAEPRRGLEPVGDDGRTIGPAPCPPPCCVSARRWRWRSLRNCPRARSGR